MDAQSESCETPPSDPQAPGKIRKAFKLFGKGKPGSSVASIFTRRGKGEGDPKSPVTRSKTLEGLSESTTATQDAPEVATVSEPTASPQQPQQEGSDPDEPAQNEQPSAEEPKPDLASSPTRPSISSMTSAKSLSFLSLLRRNRRGGGAGGEGDRQVHTEAHRGERQRKGLRSLFGSMRWRRHDDETDEGAGPPLTASRSNSVEIIKEHLTLTPRPAPRAEGERDLTESTVQSQAPASQPNTPKPAAAAAAWGASQLNPNASVAEPNSDRLSTLLGDISSILSFDSLTGCGDIVADVEAEWAKASSRVGASAAAAKDQSDDTDSGEKSLSSSATPSGKLSSSPAPVTPTPTPTRTPLTTAKPITTPTTNSLASSPLAAKPVSPTPTASHPAYTDVKPPPVHSPVLSPSSLSASPQISKSEPKPAPAPVPTPTPMPAAPKQSAIAATAPKPTPPATPAAPAAKFISSQMSGAKLTTTSRKPPPKIVTTIGLSCHRERTSPPTKPASGFDAKPPTPTTKSAPVSTFSDATTSVPAAAKAPVVEPDPAAKAPVSFSAPVVYTNAATPAPLAPAAYKPPPSYSAPPALTPPQPLPAFMEPSSTTPAPAPSSRPPPIASPVSPPSPLPPFSPPPAAPAAAPLPTLKPAAALPQPPSAPSLSSSVGRAQSAASSPPEGEARVDGGEDLASPQALEAREAYGQRGAPEVAPPGGGGGAQGACGDKRSPAMKPAILSKIPVSGGGRPAVARGQQASGREAHSNGDDAAASWGTPTPVGSQEDMLHSLSRDTGSRDTLSGFAGQSPTASPPISPPGLEDDCARTPSPPEASAARPSSKIGVPSGIPRSGIPIKRDTHAAPTYHSLQGKGDAPRTKIPVSKVPVRRGGHAAIRK